MAIYRVQGPDGSIHRFEGPDDATPDQVTAAAAQQFASPQVKTDDPGPLGAIGIGFGRTADRMGQGIKQASLALTGFMNPSLKGATDEALAKQAQEQQFKDEGYKPLQQQHPLTTMAGEAAPLLAMPMGGSVLGAAALGAVPGLVEYGSAGDKLSRGGAGALGGSLGYGIGKGIGTVLSPGMSASTPEAGKLAQAMAQNGIPLDAAQVTGSQVLQNTKAALSRIPWTAGGQQAADAGKQEAYNRAILKFLGSDGKAATPDVMADAYTGITSKMNNAAQSATITLDDAAISKLADVEKNFLRRLPTDQKAVVRSYLDDLTNTIGQPIPGDVYNKTRSALGDIAFNSDNITVREGAKGMQKVLDDAFDRQNPADVVQAMKEARAQYAKYQTVADAMKKARTTDGNLPPKQMYAQAQRDIPGFERGNGGDFNSLVRGGRQFLPDPVPNSGTPERMLYQNLLTLGSMSGLGAASGALAGQDPVSGAAMGALGFGVSKGAQRALNSPLLTKYLMAQAVSPEQKALLARIGATSGLLGGAALSR